MFTVSRSPSVWLCFATLAFVTSGALNAQDRPKVGEGVQFPLDKLFQTPEVFPADGMPAEGAKAFYYSGSPFKGKPTRIFAYYGVPKPGADANSRDTGPGKYPAMVLIHGGGGTAFDRWVKVWNAPGYAAIAMDLCGCIPVGTYGNWKRHEQGGPPDWDASFGQLGDAIEDQWTHQAVCAVALWGSGVPITSAELAWTRDVGKWQDRKWEQLPATVDSQAGRVSIKIPAEARVFDLNLFDNRNCAISSQHVER